MEIRFVIGDLTDLEVDAIVNPANCEGEMGGGVAGAIKKAGGKEIEDEAMEQAPVSIGKAIVTAAGKLKCRYVIHSPTMEMPVQKTSVQKIAQATQAALEIAKENDFNKLAIPGMGTGTGKVPIEKAAQAMIDVIKMSPALTKNLKELILVDRNAEMVQAWERAWNEKREDDSVKPHESA